MGKPALGGSFTLVDHNGVPFTDLELSGKFYLIYFGFTFCPDICPTELEKMAKVLNALGYPSFHFYLIFFVYFYFKIIYLFIFKLFLNYLFIYIV